MRKHFLLLFLMALLPLAGFATITVSTQPTLADDNGVTYNGGDKTPVQADGTATGTAVGYTWYYAVNTVDVAPDIDAENTWYSKANLKVKNAGTYYVYYKVVPSVESSEAVYGPIGIGTYTIGKADLANTDYTAPTGAAANSLTFDNSAKALLTEAATYGTTGSAEKCGAITYTLNSTNYSNYADVKATNAGEYTISWEFAGSANYNGKSGNVNVTIGKKAFTTANLTIEVTNNTKTYNGQAQEPTIKVKDIALSTTETPVYLETTDYAVTYALSTDNTETTHQGVGTHNITITGTAAGNYSDAAIANAGALTINKATAYVQINDVSKNYTGLAYAPVTDGAFEFTYSGLKAGETTAQANITNNATVSGYAGVTDAGSYKVLTLGETVSNVTSRNYQFIEKAKGTLTINQVPLTVTLPTAYSDNVNQKKYGDDDPNFSADAWKTANITLTGVVKYDSNNDHDFEDEGDIDETAAILADLTISRTNASVEAAGTYEGVLVATATTTNALKNYTYDLTQGTGNFKIQGVKLYIGINDQEVTYTGEQAVLPTLTIDDLIVSNLQGDDTAEGVIGENIPTLAFTSNTPAINQGYYDIELSGLTNMGSYEVEYISGSLHIKPATLTATIPTQTLKVNVNTFDATKWSVEGLVGDDTVEDLGGTLTNVQGYNAAGTYNNGISLAITNTNYVLDGADANGKVYGKLVVLADNQFMLSTANTSLATELATLNGEDNMTITFETMPMAAKEWRAMVLPFDITPAELVTKLGVYVVVNKFKSAAYDSKKPTKVNVNFALEMDKIDAGVPFLIKPAAAINWNKDANNSDISFTNKTIVAAPIPQGQLADTPTDDKATFKGTYNKGEILWWGHGLDGTTTNPLKSKWLCYNGATKYAEDDPTTTDGTYTTTTEKSENTWKEPETRPHLLSPMEAYVLLDAAATEARIFVEDIENGVTSIKELGVDGTAKAYSVDGWYTLDGVKLQSAPAQKGIYINNGKKVVIK